MSGAAISAAVISAVASSSSGDSTPALVAFALNRVAVEFRSGRR
jgi:hypothetical protein